MRLLATLTTGRVKVATKTLSIPAALATVTTFPIMIR